MNEMQTACQLLTKSHGKHASMVHVSVKLILSCTVAATTTYTHETFHALIKDKI